MSKPELVTFSFGAVELENFDLAGYHNVRYIKLVGSDGNLIGSLEVDPKLRLEGAYADPKVGERKKKEVADATKARNDLKAVKPTDSKMNRGALSTAPKAETITKVDVK